MFPKPPVPHSLQIQYLPDTYFPYSKRTLLHRPYTQEIDSQTCRSKRQRTGPSPVEHRRLTSIKKIEREMNTKNSSCPTQRSLMHTPLHILQFIQDQGTTVKRTNETIEELSVQIKSITEKLSTTQPPLSPPKPNLILLRSYHTIIIQTLGALKSLRDQSPIKTIRMASESIPRIRYLIMLQCNFDVFGGGDLHMTSFPSIYESADLQTSWPVVYPSFQGNGPTPNWHSVYTTLGRMELNLRRYMDIINTGSWPYAIKNQTHPPIIGSTSTAQTNFQTSTAAQRRWNPRPEKRKATEESPTLQHQSSPIISSFGNISGIKLAREKLAPKRFSFSYEPNRMDVD